VKRIRPSVQITIGLVLLTSAVLLLVNLLFDVFPDPDAQLVRVRNAHAESLATQVSVLLQRGDENSLALALARARARDSSIRSLAVRRAGHALLARSGDHERAWGEPRHERSALTHLLVPLSQGGERWGSFEMTFFPDARGALQRAFGHPLWVTLLGSALIGALVYWVYIRRALVHLDPTAVIPERVRLAFDIMTEGVAVLDSRGRLLLANSAFRALPGEDRPDLLGTRLSDLPWLAAGLAPNAAEHPWSRAMHKGQPVMGVAIEVAPSASVRRRLVVNCAPIGDTRGVVRGCIATFADLTALHVANERLTETLTELRASRDEIEQKNVELEHMATHDPLTGCLTRRAFFDRMAHARDEARRNSTPLSCFALDIDQFKSVNDSFGHVVGDRVVEEVGKTLVASLRATDIVGRYGGDEFFVGMPGCEIDQALALAEKVRRNIEQHCSSHLTAFPGLRVTVSIGVAVMSGGATTVAALIEQADQALYTAKSSGRNRVEAAS
jgi:diguanylate cyclase (GGDEF)-like protein